MVISFFRTASIAAPWITWDFTNPPTSLIHCLHHMGLTAAIHVALHSSHPLSSKLDVSCEFTSFPESQFMLLGPSKGSITGEIYIVAGL